MKCVLWLIFICFFILLFTLDSTQWSEIVFAAFATAAVFYAFARSLGWIVRGILGIPSDRDFPTKE